LAFSPDGKTLAVGCQFGELSLFDTVTRQLTHKADVADEAAFWGLVFSSDGKTLAQALGPGILKIWDPETQLVRASLKAHTKDIRGLAISPDRQTLVTSSFDGTVRLWDADTGQHRLSLKVPLPPNSNAVPLAVAFSPDGNTLAIGCWHVHLLRAATSAEARGRKIAIDFDDPDSPLLLNTHGDRFWKSGNLLEVGLTHNS
jgi:WD40 repeat protein